MVSKLYKVNLNGKVKSKVF